MIQTPKALKITWNTLSEMLQTEMQKILGRDICCEAKPDDDCYWCIGFPMERMPMSDLFRVLEVLEATPKEQVDSIPSASDHAETVSCLGMGASELLLSRCLGYQWQSLHIEDDCVWVLGEADPLEKNPDIVKIGDKAINLSELKCRQEVISYLHDRGPNHATLMDMCDAYRKKYQNELCWHYPISDGKHLGTFLLLVKEGILSIPYDDADKVDYELFCLDDACLFNLEAIEDFILDWHHFDVDLRKAMAGMKKYLQKKEAINEYEI